MQHIQRLYKVKAMQLLTLVCALMIVSAQAFAQQSLTVLHCWTEHRNDWVNEMLDAFEAAHPGVTVTGQLTACGNTILEEFVTQVIGGTPPDVVMMHSLNIPGTVDRGFLLPLDAHLQRDAISMDTWYPSEIETGRWNGQLFGLPMRTGGDTNSLLYYNKTTFNEAGIGDVPSTWEEWLQTAQKLTRYDGDKLVRAGSAFYGGDFSEAAWFASGGGSIFSQDAKRIEFSQDAGVEAVTFMQNAGQRLYRGGWPELNAMFEQMDQSTYGSGPRGAFASGRLAMWPNGILEYSYLNETFPDLDFGIGVRPALEAGGPSGVNAGTFHWAMVQGTEDPSLTWELVKWLSLREETAGYFMLRQARPSPVRAFNSNPAYFEMNPDWLIVGEALARSTSLPMLPYTSQVLNLLASSVGSALFGDEDPGTALEEAASQAQGIVNEYWNGK